jgi:hypothetical protein
MRAVNATGEQRVVYGVFVMLGVVSLLLFLVGGSAGPGVDDPL